jgi:hypothetical protein
VKSYSFIFVLSSLYEENAAAAVESTALLTILGGRRSEKLQFYFCVQFPMKKVLLLLWKVLLTSLGGSEELQFNFCVQFPMKKVLLLC